MSYCPEYNNLCGYNQSAYCQNNMVYCVDNPYNYVYVQPYYGYYPQSLIYYRSPRRRRRFKRGPYWRHGGQGYRPRSGGRRRRPSGGGGGRPSGGGGRR